MDYINVFPLNPIDGYIGPGDIPNPIPLQQFMLFNPEWVAGLIPNAPISEYINNPANPALYNQGSYFENIDLFTNRENWLGQWFKTYIGHVTTLNPNLLIQEIDMSWIESWLGTIWGTKLKAMGVLQYLEQAREQRIMQIHYSEYSLRYNAVLLAMLSSLQPTVDMMVVTPKNNDVGVNQNPDGDDEKKKDTMLQTFAKGLSQYLTRLETQGKKVEEQKQQNEQENN